MNHGCRAHGSLPTRTAPHAPHAPPIPRRLQRRASGRSTLVLLPVLVLLFAARLVWPATAPEGALFARPASLSMAQTVATEVATQAATVRLHLPLALREAHRTEGPAVPTSAAPSHTRSPSTGTPPSAAASATPTPSPAPTATPTAIALPSPTALPAACRNVLVEGGFEGGPEAPTGWQEETRDGSVLVRAEAARRGAFGARLGGRPASEDVLLSDTVVPTFAAEAFSATLRLWLRVESEEPIGDGAQDRLIFAVVGDVPEAVELFASLGDDDRPQSDPPSGPAPWVAHAFDVSAAFTTREDFATARLSLVALTNADDQATTFDVDDIALEVCAFDSRADRDHSRSSRP